MNIDFHVHGSLSSKLPFDLNLFRNLVVRARQVGMNAVALTDHFHAADFLEILHTLEEEYPYTGDCFDAAGLRVFPGIEVEVREGMHLLAIGGRTAIESYYHRLEGHFMPETYISTAEFFEKQSGLEILSIAAHPFRSGREINQLDPALYPRFDAIDLNARDLFSSGEALEVLTEMFGTQYQIPVVAGSDTHHYLQLGVVYNQFENECTTIAELKRAIAARAYTIYIDPDLSRKVAMARAAKQAIKAEKLQES